MLNHDNLKIMSNAREAGGMAGIVAELREVLKNKRGRAAMESAVRLLKERERRFTWVGIYLREGDELVLGPFLGKPSPHIRIPIGQGICGAAAREEQTIIVPDVNADTRYLACSLETRSEIVVPIFRGAQVIGEIDIDSDMPDAFGPADREMLEQAAALLAERIFIIAEQIKTKVVTAAVIIRGGELLICQRSARQSHAFKWEFAGGKLEEGEDPADCLRRELREELGIDARLGPEIARFRYQYPGRTPIELIFYRVTEFEGEPENLVFHDIRWVPPGGLSEFDFLDADRELVARLARGEML